MASTFTNPGERGGFRRLAGIAFLGLVVSGLASAAEEPLPMPLPPPPELMDYAAYDPDGAPEIRPAGDNPAATMKALEPPPAFMPAPPPPSLPEPARIEPAPMVVSAPLPAPAAQTAGSVRGMSPPRAVMPADYFNLPMDMDESGAQIPGVLVPEFDESFSEPGYDRLAARAIAEMGRSVDPGMSIRQLEPYFALAKGSEAAALEAKERGDDALYRDQIGKSIQAYMAIIEMADASTEAREESWYGVGRCEYRLGNWWRSFDAIERSFPKQYERSEVAGRIKLEMFIGERLWRMADSPVAGTSGDGEPLTGYQAASRVYAAALFNQPMAKDAPLAYLRRGDAAAKAGEWEEAAKLYRSVVEYYPESPEAMEARSALAETVYRREWTHDIPEAARPDLMSLMDDVERAPELTPAAEERRQRAVSLANSHEAETKLRHAKQYLKNLRMRKSRDAAVFLLGEIVSHYPNTEQAGEAAQMLRDMGVTPPMVLSDGSRFPLRGGWSPDDPAGTAAIASEGAGGTVRLEGQDDIGGGAFAPPTSRETVFQDVPGVIDAETWQ